jgi:putative acetyltransferase
MRQEARLVDLVRSSEHHVPGLALLAEEGGVPLGYVLLSRAILEGAERHPVLALAPLCVRPDRQLQGIGSALVREGLARAGAGGWPLVTVLGDPGYYRRLGFEPAAGRGVEPPPGGHDAEHLMVMPLAGYRPGVRGRLRYPPAFDGL